MRGLPLCCLEGCLLAQKVAYFPCAESQREFRQLSMNPRVNSGDTGLPALAMVSLLGNLVLLACCREGCR